MPQNRKMGAPPTRMVAQFRDTWPWLSTAKPKTFSICVRAAVVVTVLAGLLFLAGCQGISTSNSTNLTRALTSNPATLSFGNVVVGIEHTVSETLTNTSSSSISISAVNLSGAAFKLAGVSVPMTLSGGQSANISVTFAPTAAGSANGSISVASSASNSLVTIALSGTGTTSAGQLTATPSTLSVGSVVVGTSGTASGHLSVSGADVTITAATSDNSQFSIGGLALPLTIPSNQSVLFTVTFSPNVTGAASATLSFTSNAQSATTTQTLTGSGSAAPSHTVNLSWNASTSSNILGYNIYRATYAGACGSFSKINASLNTTTLYTDDTVTDGASYCYATTAVNSSSEESGYSNIVSHVQIPAP